MSRLPPPPLSALEIGVLMRDRAARERALLAPPAMLALHDHTHTMRETAILTEVDSGYRYDD
ncbi:MAG TPA: hypothetical protein VGE72_23125 [Azospirillum sp.]